MCLERVQKVLSRRGYGSRRMIEQLIIAKKIILNKKIVVLGDKINIYKKNQFIIDSIKVTIQNEKIQKKMLLYHKPIGEISTHYDPFHKNTVFKNLPVIKKNRWLYIGRLDINTSGLLLFTNCGIIANYAMHPKNLIKRVYLVRFFGTLNNNKISLLKNGIQLEKDFIAFKEIKLHNHNKTNKWLKITLYEGKNREIRKLLNYLNIQVSRIIRIKYGDVKLPFFLKPKKWVYLNYKKINFLKKIVN
ncbi:pseudouridine synthase [Buchnera aphidicola (Thelaxes californica)]|uniref:Pseudouridine synthase n=1 Tax=Buchnera aphidicola (Thelaxes californica) TaxID=1315998 RepID=A0A4D6YD75_9GAMM|nr:pseudouridine synthase [Buchnera aphidicola]QCI26992.1 pseudouridine synthase [Buchnera aphidicola (Thelaxes californica)]